MKTLKKKLKTLVFLLVFILGANGFSQNESNNSLFVRVYNLNGKKINKGKIIKISDTLLQLKTNKRIVNIAVNDIGSIKTKRSGGNNILIGSLIGATTGAIFGAATAEPDSWVFGYTSAEGAVGFGVIGALGGAAIGGITVAFKESETFYIAGKFENWKVFKDRVEVK